MKTLGIREARVALSELVGGKERVVVTVRGRPEKALVAVKEARLLERMEEAGTLDAALSEMEER